MLDFGITDIPKSKARRLWILQNFLLQGQRDGKINVLIIDEAHKVSIELMEEIRLLGNLEHGTDKLLQILLTGQPELEDVLSRPELWQFKQRINVHLSLEALSYEEIDRYIKHRWTVAGGRVPTPFTPEAVAVVMKRSTGIPRLVNSICDNALTLAFADESEKVTVGHVENAARDLRLIPRTAQAPVVSKLTAPAPPPPMRPETERPLASFAAASSAGPNGKPTAVEPAPEETPEFAVPGASQKSLLGRWASKIGLGRNGKNA